MPPSDPWAWDPAAFADTINDDILVGLRAIADELPTLEARAAELRLRRKQLWRAGNERDPSVPERDMAEASGVTRELLSNTLTTYRAKAPATG